MTSDERKTLTKIPTCKTSHNHSPNQRTLWTRRNKKTSKQPNKEKEEKAVCTWRNVTSASTSDSSSEVELYLSSLNRGADDIELGMGDMGRDTSGVNGLCGPGGSIGGVVSSLSAVVASGDWVGTCCCCSLSPSLLPEVASFLVGLVLAGRLSPSDSSLLHITLVLVDIMSVICTKFYFNNLFRGTRSLKQRKWCEIQICNFSLSLDAKEKLKKWCELRICNFSSSFVAREFAKLWRIYVNFVPFSCKNRANFVAFSYFSVVPHERFLLYRISRLQQISKVKPICIFIAL